MNETNSAKESSPRDSASFTDRSSSASSSTLVGFLWSNRARFAPGLCFALARIVSIAAFPLIYKDILDHRMPNRDVGAILGLAVMMVALLFVHQVLSVAGARRTGRAVTELVMKLRAEIFDKIQLLSFGYLDRQNTGRLLSKYAFDTQKIDGVAMPLLNGFVPDTLYSILTLTILVSLNWQLALVIVLLLPIFATMRYRYFRPLQAKNEENRVAQERLTGAATEVLGAIRLVRSYGEERGAEKQLRNANDDVAETRVQLISVSSQFGAFSWGAVQLLSLVVIAGGATLAAYGQMSAGTVLAFVAGLPALVQPIQLFTNLSGQYFLGRDAYQSIRELLDERDTESWHGTRRPEPLRGRIEFDDVRLRYPGATRDALNGFTLAVEPGQKIALVGSSGAGKSTVASVLLGLYAPSAGQVRIDGVPMPELDVRWLRRQTAIVMQESVLLSGTIADNIRFAQTTATDEQVREAARRAQAEEFILRAPNGYDTRVGERGVTLSGGQRQRLSIARAILRNPALLILDEPTSALDYEGERLIQAALDEVVAGRTVITIAHRLSTIRNADLIVVMADGRVTESGTFEELAGRAGGAFARMLASQELAIDSPADLPS